MDEIIDRIEREAGIPGLAPNSVVRADFDRLAAFDTDEWDNNNHYHAFLLSHVPSHCDAALEIGCGTGQLARELARRADHVDAYDLSSEMIALARRRSVGIANISFQVADILAIDLPAKHYDAIVSVATLHHLPLEDCLARLKAALRPGGCLACLDLYEGSGWQEWALGALALPATAALRLLHNRHLRQSREVRAAWAEHGAHDTYLRLAEVRKIAEELLPEVTVRRHLLWRYSLIWHRPA